MAQRRSRNITLLFLLLCGIVLLILGNIFPSQRRAFFSFVFSPLQKLFWQAGEELSLRLSSPAEKLRGENNALWLENQSLRAEIERLKLLEEENKSLREAWEGGLRKEFSLLPVRAIAVSSFEDILFLDGGARDGIEKGMPVISSQKVLYGFVGEVFERSSRVRLLSHRESRVVVSVAEKKVSGTVRGLGRGEVVLDFIPREAELQEGSLILTAHQEEYPEGLLVGLVQKALARDVEPFLQFSIQPFFEKAGFLHLFVVKDF